MRFIIFFPSTLWLRSLKNFTIQNHIDSQPNSKEKDMISVVAFCITTFLLFLTVVHSQENCSRTCTAQNCDGMSIRYGKYCGIGYFGCRGEPPCDDLDTCCMTHDNCVELKGMTYVNCHKQFQRCVNKLNVTVNQSNGKKVGFSKECPYSMVIPTVYNGMSYGIVFSGIGNILKPPEPAGGAVVKVEQGLEARQGSKVSASLNKRPSPS